MSKITFGLFVLIVVILPLSCSNQFSALPKEVGIFFEENLHDPNSFELVKISYYQLPYDEFRLYVGGVPKGMTVETYLHEGDEIQRIQNEILKDSINYPILHTINYRAKNGFGVLRLNTRYCVTLPNGNFLGCYDNFDDYADGIYNGILKPKL